MNDDSEHRMSLFAERVRSVVSSVGQDEHLKQAAAATKDVAVRAEEASKAVSRKVTQEDAWEELRSDVEQLTEIVSAHHALIVDLIDRFETLGAGAAVEVDTRHGR
jgi:Cu/Ag efflux pump CusA